MRARFWVGRERAKMKTAGLDPRLMTKSAGIPLHHVWRHDVGAALLLIAAVVARLAHGIQLAPSRSEADLRLTDPVLHELFLHELRATIGQHQVVEDVAANIGVALNPQVRVGMLLQVAGIGLQDIRVNRRGCRC